MRSPRRGSAGASRIARCVTLHGRPLEAIIPHLHDGARILALSWDDATPAKLAALLTARGMGRSKLTICEAMGGPCERIRTTEARGFALENVAELNTIALEVVADSGASILPRAPGLPDDWFEHDGQITKREIRAMTLSQLAPRRGELLWDVGSGSGSIAIEWMLADASNSAVAIEVRHDRAERIACNALSFGVPGLSVVTGEAPQVFIDLAKPDAIFIGGGASAPGMIERAFDALPPGGRLIVNAVTLETQAACVDWRARWGGELAQISVAHAEPVGRYSRLARGDADRAVAARQVMSRIVAIGVGCRAGVAGEAIAALAQRALAEAGAPEGERRMFTLDAKADEPGLVEAARLLRAKLTPLPLAALNAQADRILTPSAAAQARFGAPNIAEAAALAGAGEGARLLGPRLTARGATCAVALSPERPCGGATCAVALPPGQR